MIKKKSIITFMNIITISLIGIVIFIISLLFYIYIYRNSVNDAFDSYESNLHIGNNSLEVYYHDVQNFASALSIDSNLNNSIDSFYSGNLYESYEAKNMISYILGNAVKLIRYIQNICIYSDDNIYYYNSYYSFEKLYSDKIKSEKWFEALRNNKVDSVVIPNYTFGNGVNKAESDVFIYATKMKISNNISDKIILLTMNSNRIKSVVKDLGIDKTSIVYLVDENGKLIYSENTNDGFKTDFIEQLSSYNSKDEVEINNKAYYIVKDKNEVTGWELVCFLDKSIFYDKLSVIQPYLILLVFIVIISSIIVQQILFRKITLPLKNFVKKINNMKINNLQEINIHSQYIEIQQAEQSFNDLIIKVNQLIEELVRNNTEKRKAEYKVLEHQINPHFIYNTLDAIKWHALINKSPQIAEMIAVFVRLLQISLSNGMEMIPIEREVEHIANYIKIMEYRNNFNIEVTYNVEKEALNLFMLKLVIQPFVENCYLHAFDNNITNKKIDVEVKLVEKDVIIKIIDNGKGIQKEETAKKMFSGLGIKNVEERIKLWHGDGYGVEIHENYPTGTVVQIKQPVIYNIETDKF